MARLWTADRILAAIQTWADRTGRLPTANEWREKAADGMAPTTDRVIKGFGSWSEAIEAAGFTPRAPQAGSSERSITRMVESYAHAADERGLDEIAGPRSPVRPILAAEDLRCGVSSGARVLLAYVAPSSYPSFVLGREVA